MLSTHQCLNCGEALQVVLTRSFVVINVAPTTTTATKNHTNICYDFAYLPVVEKSISEQRMIQKVVIVQQQDFMKKFDPWQPGQAGIHMK